MKNNIPRKFYRASIRTPRATNVGELKALLNELPDALALGRHEEDIVYLNVYNINERPFLAIEDDDLFPEEDEN